MSDRRGSAPRVILLGALSTIAEALARQLAAEGASLVLAARDAGRLEQVASDLEARGAKATVWTVDLAKERAPRLQLERMVEAVGGLVDAVVVIYGVLGDNRAAETDETELDRIIDTNFSSAARWCLAAAAILERQKHGTLLAVSSVAADRGRQSNYVYGAAKAGLVVMMQGLAHRLAPSNARAVVVKLGFVDTAMTSHIEKGGPLWAAPETVARQLRRLLSAPSAPVVYVPWFWRPFMFVIRNLPTAIFHRTKL